MSSHAPEPYLPLRGMALAPASQKAYSKQLGSFLSHAGLDVRLLLAAPAYVLDRALAVYIQFCYDAQSSFAYASHALCAVVHRRPDLRHQLPLSRQCIRGWDKVRTSSPHAPLTWELTVLIACTMARSGYHGPAIAILLAFDCFLRVGELTRIRKSDVVMPNDSRMGRAHTTMAVVLRTAKTGKMQSVEIWSPDVAQLLMVWVRASACLTPSPFSDPDPRVFPFSPDFLRRLMQRTSTALQLPTHYTPHSLRHGGTTDDFLRNGSVERVQFRGRWKSLESVRRYVQTARAVLAAQRVPRHLNDLGVTLSSALVPTLSHLLRTVPAVVPRSYRRRVTFGLPVDTSRVD
jgi:integrase